MLEFKTKLNKYEFVYQLDDGILSLFHKNGILNNTISLDLRNSNLSSELKSRRSQEFKLALFGCFVVIVIGIYFLHKDVSSGDQAGIIGSIFGIIVGLGMCLYYLIKNWKKQTFLLLKAPDKTGIRVFKGQANNAEYEEFIYAIQLELEKAMSQR